MNPLTQDPLPCVLPTETHGRRKALLIAIKHMNDLPTLGYSHRDARALKTLLTDVYGYKDENVVMMLDPCHKPGSLSPGPETSEINQKFLPTRGNIVEQIRLLSRGALPNDQFFFYFSGHGHQVICNHHTESDGKEEAIYDCNGETIIDNELKKFLISNLPKGSKLFALWDTCHSTTLLDLEHHYCNDHHAREAEATHESLIGRTHSTAPKKHAQLTLDSTYDVILQPYGCPVLFPWDPSSHHLFPHAPGRDGTSSWIHRRWHKHTAKHRPLGAAFAYTIPYIDAAITMGSNPDVASPMSQPMCSPTCEYTKPEDREKAHVISLAACRDDQVAYDDNEKQDTMTKFFVQALKRNPRITLGDLLLEIRECTSKITERRLECQGDPSEPGHTHLYQRPGYASHYRLDLSEEVDL
ncbi:hypothetical protein HYDPIDRAFT_115724 [Hydnomerulius pinastri MD-312]|uniref:Peptidase C14 caspase domain-containing protein n=1 Tax=Hydnomerulius pinastri MD-312 TaxID=994086 RepID=A0A0C9W4V8_9AGAM|nr:hypothetical protein HYDPIDRAFT_115724 [Hydnomerulius pinastri MD-312]